MEPSSSFANGLLEPVVRLGIPALYVALAWLLYVRYGRVALFVWWISASVLLGYLWYRNTCSQPMTCDVGGADSRFLTGSPYYFFHYFPFLSAVILLAFGAATLVVMRRHRPGAHLSRWPTTILLGWAAAVLTVAATVLVLHV